MICFRDMTFCSFYKECAETKCHRALTPEIKHAAERTGLGICQFAEKPECFKEK